MQIAQACAVTLIFHELYYYALEGRDSFLVDFMPALGLRLARPLKCLLHTAVLIASLATVLNPGSGEITLLAILVIIYCANHRQRLSNHLLIVSFVLLVCFMNNNVESMQLLDNRKFIICVLGLIYFFGFFHKINRAFLSQEKSCANVYFRSILQERFNITPWGVVEKILPFSIVAIEAALLVALHFPPLYGWAFIAAIFLHYLFGITGNPHFSVLMNCLLLVVINEEIAIEGFEILVVVLFAVFTFIITDRSRFRIRWAENLSIFLFGGLSGLSCILVFKAIPEFGHPELIFQKDYQMPFYAWAALFLLFINCCSAYFGKTEFCLAMFSGLRPDLNNHYFFKRIGSKNFLERNYYEILEVRTNRLARNNSSLTIRLAVQTLDQHVQIYYGTRFLNETLRLLSRNNISISIKLRMCKSERSFWIDETQTLDVRGLTDRFSAYPPYLAKNDEFAYMG
ncbi:hypothetical protein [Pseudomonas reactans]|uniref:hypothetical protein n=1 Tax=Pseudomonas reactans TaxID=117680 RepID=UPI0015A01129|nr:hypothetical protein [Pseudomonas reactans]NWA67717.1 hypothetical protein [Pseudomonas reactans]